MSLDSQGYAFRRSRTLTGTTSDNVTAGAEARSQLKTARLQVHELHRLRRHIVQALAGVSLVIVIGSFVLASYIPGAQLRYTQSSSTPDASAYQQAILGYFGKHPLERFNFMTNVSQLANDVEKAHPEVLSLGIDRGFSGSSVQFVLQFRRPILAWETGGQKFYVDDKGVAFQYDHFHGAYVSVSDKSGISPSVTGGAVASNGFISFLGKMVGAVNAGSRGKVADVVIPASTREVDLKLQGRGYPIKTHTDRDPLAQAQDILSALKWFDDKKITPQYIDVRVAGKAYFK